MYTKLSIIFLVVLGITGQLASANTIEINEKKESIVQWSGIVRGDSFYHTTNHKHQLEFIRDGDLNTFDIVDSPELVKLHHNSEKNLRIQLTGEITSRFLFWGGNLVVKSFKILEELENIPHQKPQENKRIRENI